MVSFVLQVIEKGYNIDIAASDASYTLDKTRILNSIAGAAPEDLDEEPDLQHPEFAKVNNTLQTMFAKAAMVAACVQ